jgi:hypothetical protein
MSSTATENSSDNVDQILWSRTVFGVCAALGVLPFFGWPLALFTSNVSPLQTTTFILASVTVFPTCILAFWYRTPASIWLVAAALFLVSANFFETKAFHGDWYMLGLLAVPGVFGLISSALHWPPPIKRKFASEKRALDNSF